MAKKKSKSKKAEPAKKAQKKKSNTAGWVIGAIIVIVIIIAIILLLRGCAKEPATTTTPTTPGSTETPSTSTEAKGTEILTGKPDINLKCAEEYAIGWPETHVVPDPCTLNDKGAQVSLMYSGRGESLPGLFFEVTTMAGKVTYLRDARVVKQGDIVEYNIPDLGDKIDTMLAMPMIIEDGKESACLNQRLLVIKATNCVRD